jgi:hypothetical protein
MTLSRSRRGLWRMARNADPTVEFDLDPLNMEMLPDTALSCPRTPSHMKPDPLCRNLLSLFLPLCPPFHSFSPAFVHHSFNLCVLRLVHRCTEKMEITKGRDSTMICIGRHFRSVHRLPHILNAHLTVAIEFTCGKRPIVCWPSTSTPIQPSRSR